jgi:filamentous hemagglutinin family protein
MKRASLNHSFRLVWSKRCGGLMAVAETTRGRGKGAAIGLSTALLMSGLPLVSQAALPTGGSVEAGSGSISQNGNAMTINQGSDRLAINWNSFSIGAGNSVTFNQPNSSSVALNRVLGSEVSVIQGALNANGQVFLVNPNGVLFSPTAQVNVGSIVASTLDISAADFMAGNYRFEGHSSNAIINQGNIQAANGGSIALIAAQIINTGNLTANGGNVLLGAGSRVTLDLGGPVKLDVEEAAIDALIEQGGAIRADGGRIYLTAKAAGDLARTVINHTGITEARTLSTGDKGEIVLLGDMDNDRIQVAGTLDASAPHGGDGGFIETSAANVNISNDLQVTTAASTGRTGQWLIDPVDITIAASGGNVTGSALATALQSTNVTLDTAGAGNCTGVSCTFSGANGDIFIEDDINVTAGSADTTLTLKANRNIFMDAGTSITRTGDYKLDTVLWADSDASGGGAIWLGKGNTVSSSSATTIASNGGDIILSGGSNLATGYAEGVNGVIGNGVTLDRAELLSDGGNIVVRGKSATTSTSLDSTDDNSNFNTDGIRLHGGNTLDAGSGTISLTGIAQGTNGSSNGIETNSVGYSTVRSSSSSANAISFYGDATAGSASNGWGTFLWGTNTSGILLAATGAGGGISLDGYGRNVANGGGTHLEPNAFVLAADGPIAIAGTKGAASTYESVVINSTVGFVSALPAGFGISSPVTASSSDISLTADSLSANYIFGGGAFSGSAVQSSGTLSIATRSPGKALSVQTSNPGGTGLWINPTSIFGASGLFKTGFSKLVFGSATTGDVTLNNYTFDNATELNTGGKAVLGAVSIANNALTVNMTGSGSITNTGVVSVSQLLLNGSSSAATLTNAGNAIGTLAANLASLSLVNGSALQIGTVGATSGVSATGTIGIETLSGNLTVAQNIATSSTSTDAIRLNAGRNSAAGTSSGGNIIISGSPSISTGLSGRVTLFTGNVAGSTGLTALVGSGSGRFRYNTDEASNGYDTLNAALGSGLYALYREQPLLLVTPGSASSALGAPISLAGISNTISGYANGDDATLAGLSGMASYSTDATNSSNAGSYQISYTGGLSNILGYGIADNSASTGEYSIIGNTSPTSEPPAIQPPLLAAVSSAQASVTLPNSPSGGGRSMTNADGLSASAQTGLEFVATDSADTPNQTTQGGAQPSGFMQVFVVNGGINVPSDSEANADDENGEDI